MSVTGCPVPLLHGRFLVRLAAGGVNFAGLAARTTPLPGWLLPAV